MSMTEPEFRALLERYLNGKASPEESSVLDQFFDSYRDEHPGEPGMSVNIHSDIKQAILKKLHGKEEATPVIPIKRSTMWLKVAAVVSFAVIGSYVLFSRYSSPIHTTEKLVAKTVEHSTTRGQRYNVVLPDGTRVKLNSNSKLSYSGTFEGNTREVTLDGEAYFDVVHDITKPFVVHTGSTSTKVLGTSFNVHSAKDAVTVTLVEGKVNVFSPTADAMLLPNQQAIVKAGSKDIHTTEVDVSQYTAWTNNRLIFENTPLPTAFAMLENWYNVDFNVDSASFNNCVITGKYENESLENVLNSFSFMLKIDYTISKHEVTVKGKGCN